MYFTKGGFYARTNDGLPIDADTAVGARGGRGRGQGVDEAEAAVGVEVE